MKTPETVHHKQKVNVAPGERVASVILGFRLIFNGISRNRGGLFKGMSAGYLLYRGLTGHCAVYRALGKEYLPDTDRNVNIRTVIVVNQDREKVYAFWRRLENLPLFMKHLQNVETDDDKRSRWTVGGEGFPISVTWEAEIVNEIPGRTLGWSSLPGADIENAGKIEFRDVGPGLTELRINISYRAPFGDAGTAIAALFTPLFKKMVREDIENYRHFIEGQPAQPVPAS